VIASIACQTFSRAHTSSKASIHDGRLWVDSGPIAARSQTSPRSASDTLAPSPTMMC